MGFCLLMAPPAPCFFSFRHAAHFSCTLLRQHEVLNSHSCFPTAVYEQLLGKVYLLVCSLCWRLRAAFGEEYPGDLLAFWHSACPLESCGTGYPCARVHYTASWELAMEHTRFGQPVCGASVLAQRCCLKITKWSELYQKNQLNNLLLQTDLSCFLSGLWK